MPVGHYFPLEASDIVVSRIEKECQKVVSAVGMDNCSVNMDVIIRDDIPYILEASGRCGATCIPELIGMHYGFNYYEKMVKCAVGDDVAIANLEANPCVAKLIISEKSGIIIDQEIISDSKDIQASFDYTVGDKIRKFEVGPDRIGQIVAKGTHLNCNEIVSVKIKE